MVAYCKSAGTAIQILKFSLSRKHSLVLIKYVVMTAETQL